MSADQALPLEIAAPSVKHMLDTSESFLLLDCREPDEYATVHIDRALLLPMSEIAGRLDELSAYREQPIVVHCHHGGAQPSRRPLAREQGFARAQSMSGGIDQWAVEIDSTLARY